MPQAGFEPATYRSSGDHSPGLSYCGADALALSRNKLFNTKVYIARKKTHIMDISWDELGESRRLVNTHEIEPREYQINIIKSVFSGKNSLVILPTGLGKTLIAIFAIANALYNGKKALILAPTKPLSEQHYKSLMNLLKIE